MNKFTKAIETLKRWIGMDKEVVMTEEKRNHEKENTRKEKLV